MPGSLDEAINSLEKDHQFLLKGEVFTEDLIEAWIGYKRSKEIDPMRLRPHPYEFFLYYDVTSRGGEARTGPQEALVVA